MDAKTAADLTGTNPPKALPTVETIRAKLAGEVADLMAKTLTGFELNEAGKRGQKLLLEAMVGAVVATSDKSGLMSRRSLTKYANKGVFAGLPALPTPAYEPADDCDSDDEPESNEGDEDGESDD
jgi:hypothetical protein